MSKITKIAFIGDMQRVKLGPDDALIVRTRVPVSYDEAEEIKRLIKEELKVTRVLVVERGIDIGVLSEQE